MEDKNNEKITEKSNISCAPYEGQDFYCKCFNTNYCGPIDPQFVMTEILKVLNNIDSKLNLLIDAQK